MSEREDESLLSEKFSSVDQAIRAAGGFGRHQFFMVLFGMMCFAPQGFYMNTLNYLLLD